MKFKDTKYGDLTGEHYKGSVDVSSLGLTSLEGAPASVSDEFKCNDNKLTTLKGAPKSVGSFLCDDNQLVSLEGAPDVAFHFYCRGNQLTSLKGTPKSIPGTFNCGKNKLTTLEGGPTSVGLDFFCKNNQLTTLKGAPKSIGGKFNYTTNLSDYFDEEWKIRKENPNMTEEEIFIEMYRITSDDIYLTNDVKNIFLF